MSIVSVIKMDYEVLEVLRDCVARVTRTASTAIIWAVSVQALLYVLDDIQSEL